MDEAPGLFGGPISLIQREVEGWKRLLLGGRRDPFFEGGRLPGAPVITAREAEFVQVHTGQFVPVRSVQKLITGEPTNAEDWIVIALFFAPGVSRLPGALGAGATAFTRTFRYTIPGTAKGFATARVWLQVMRTGRAEPAIVHFIRRSGVLFGPRVESWVARQFGKMSFRSTPSIERAIGTVFLYTERMMTAVSRGVPTQAAIAARPILEFLYTWSAAVASSLARSALEPYRGRIAFELPQIPIFPFPAEYRPWEFLELPDPLPPIDEWRPPPERLIPTQGIVRDVPRTKKERQAAFARAARAARAAGKPGSAAYAKAFRAAYKGKGRRARPGPVPGGYAARTFYPDSSVFGLNEILEEEGGGRDGRSVYADES